MTTNITSFMTKIDVAQKALDAYETDKKVINVNLEVVEKPKGLFNCVKVLLSRVISLFLWDIHGSLRANRVAESIFVQIEEAQTADKGVKLSLDQEKKVFKVISKLNEKTNSKYETLVTKVEELAKKIQTADDKIKADKEKSAKAKAEKVKVLEGEIFSNKRNIDTLTQKNNRNWLNDQNILNNIKTLQEKIEKAQKELEELKK